MFRPIWCVLPFFFIGCKDSLPGPPPASSVQLAVEDVSCTEAWLKVSLTDSNQPRTIALRRDGQIVLTAQITANDTTITEEDLLPNHAYSYQAVRLQDSIAVDASANAQLTTLDTTSHGGFSWSVDSLGVGNSSALFDVAIINDTLAYAVGRVSLNDSSGQLDPIPYNMARWNGGQWELKRIQFYIICGGTGTTPYPARSIIAFSPTDIWIAADANQVTRWNGEAQTAIMCLPVSFGINAIWGRNASSLHAVGSSGNSVLYNGISWEILQSGTSVSLRDVYGNPNGLKLWAAGYENDLSHSTVLEYDGQTWRTVRDLPYALPRYPDSLSGLITSVWAESDRNIHAASSAGMYRFQAGSRGEGKRTWLPPPFSVGLFNRVRGSAPNNIFVVGAAGTIAHFNGVSWCQYQQFFSFSGYPNLLGLSVKGNMVIAVGYTGDRAIIIRGRNSSIPQSQRRES